MIIVGFLLVIVDTVAKSKIMERFEEKKSD